MQRFSPVGPSSGIQCWTLCTKQTMQNAHSYCRKGRLESVVRGVCCVSVCYDAVCCDGVHRDVTHPDSARVETAFWGWRYRSSLSLFSTVCCSCGSSQFPSLAGPLWCGPVGKSELQLVSFFFLVLMSEWCLFILTCRAFSVFPTLCRLHFLHDIFFVLPKMLLRMWYFLPFIWDTNMAYAANNWH